MAEFTQIFQNVWGIVMIVLFFGGSIFVHELGHFLAAKWRGLKIERFSIGMGPRVMGWRGKDGVDYRLSLLPIGGYVALPQLADMSGIEGKTDADAEKLAPLSYADKMIVSVAGAVFNIIFAIILSFIVWGFGHPVSEMNETTTLGYVAEQMPISEEQVVTGPAYAAGLRAGDVIQTIDGEKVETWRDVQEVIVTGHGRSEDDRRLITMTALRGEETINFEMEPVLRLQNVGSGEKMRAVGIAPSHTIVIDQVLEGSPALRAGLQKGDVVRLVDGKEMFSLAMLNDYLNGKADQEVLFTIDRGGSTIELPITPELVPVTKPLARVNFTEQEGESEQFMHLMRLDSNGAEVQEGLYISESPKAIQRSTALKPGQAVVAVNGAPVRSIDTFIERYNDPENNPILLDVLSRSGDVRSVVMPKGSEAERLPPIEDTRVGFSIEVRDVISHPNPAEQFYEHVTTLTRTLSGVLHPQSDISPLNLSGPVGIARIYNWALKESFLKAIWFTIFLNINLAILNLLPLPVLDGGHMMYATLEKLRRKPLPANLIATVQGAFVILLFGFMAFIIYRDILRWQGDATMTSMADWQQLYSLQNPFEGTSED